MNNNYDITKLDLKVLKESLQEAMAELKDLHKQFTRYNILIMATNQGIEQIQKEISRREESNEDKRKAN